MPLSKDDRMTSREGVRATVRVLPVDRVPVMTWLNPHRIGGRNGWLIFGFTHMLQYTLSAEHVEAILRTVRQIQQGLHHRG